MNAIAMQTDIGQLVIRCNDLGITSIMFEDETVPEVSDNLLLNAAVEQLHEYFSGDRKSFDLQLAAKGTAFQQKVWQSLLAIPYGETCSYGDIARAIDNPKGVRAVGLANGKNPISIIVPCHRVIGSNGKLTGYAGGIERKQFLLSLESQHSDFTLA